jgi:hypothetical protein
MKLINELTEDGAEGVETAEAGGVPEGEGTASA